MPSSNEITENGGQAIATAGCLKDPTPALFCMGTDTGNSAYLGTKELIKAMGGKGKIAHFTGFLVDPNTQLRIDAVHKAADEGNGAVEVVQVIADIDAPQPAEEKINAYLAANAANVDGIVTTAWVPAVVAANSLRKIGDKRIKMVGIDHDEVVLAGHQGRLRRRHHAAEPLRPGLYRLLRADKLRTGCTLKDDAPWKSNALTAKFVDSGTVFVDAGDRRHLCRCDARHHQGHTGELRKGLHDLPVMSSCCITALRPSPRHPGQGRDGGIQS
jgi:ribose transport system substrate-binding protein